MIEINEKISLNPNYIFIGDSGKNQIKYKDNIFDIECIKIVGTSESDMPWYKISDDKSYCMFEHDERPFNHTANKLNSISLIMIIDSCEALIHKKTNHLI